MARGFDREEAGPPDDYGTDAEEERRPLRLRRWLIVALVAILGAGGLWIARERSGGGPAGEVPLIRAEGGAIKERPAQPGGMAIPDQDKLVFQGGADQPRVEKLLPPPEALLPPPAAGPLPPAVMAPPGTPGVPAPAGAAPAAPVPPSAAPAAPAPVASSPPTAPVVAAKPPPSAPPVVASRPAVAVAPRPVRPAGGGWRLQLGALHSAAAARLEWTRLRTAQRDLLGALAASWPRADLGRRGIFYRIEAGPVADAAAAARLCRQLKERHVACIPLRP